MSSAHPSQYSSYSLHQPMQDSVRLPSIKDLNFPPPGQDGAPANGQGRAEHARARHESSSWGRSSAPSAPIPPSQHSSGMPPPHDPPPKHQYAPPSKPDAPYAHPQASPASQQPSAGVPIHHGVNAPASRPDSSSAEAQSKRSRSQQGVSASPVRSPHTVYPPYPAQAPPPGYHQGPPPQVAPPQEHIQHPSHYPPPGYAPYPPPQQMSRAHYAMPPPPAPVHHQNQPPASPYPPTEHWQHPSAPPPAPAQQPPPQQHFNGYARTTPLVPAPVEARAPPPLVSSPADAERANARHQIVKHCNVLYGFANHYANVTRQHPQAQPAPQEIEEMNYHASTVMRLLEDLRRLEGGEDTSRKEGDYPASTNPAEEQVRPPKRPWEDMAREGEPPSAIVHYDAQSTAEHDMQIIRNKRQSSTGGAAPGQQKNKYRKRSRATPPGKCHSCNIRETPEWRRGPDGARTLCNACGLHYAKLMRKREKTLDANGKAPPIDLQTLRASTASARGGGGEHGGETSHSQSHPPPHQGQPPPSPYDQPKQLPIHAGAPAHPGPYQLMPVGAPGPSGGQPQQMMPPPHAPSSAPHSAAGGPVPPPPWLAHPSGERPGYNSEPQSYVRASHPPSHARASPQ
ncbi:hypothetical protein BD311DRAFT_434084 [Dichomitus squalens]|uniref:GATA-type domain-containing protein n=1 Tax=Dichomitus squalens TaxID=114155 RepID=A0A4Q9MZ17_9APHY|nr:hypothetical protein BD311DRAFT_434084 [Dichomitus squalens]